MLTLSKKRPNLMRSGRLELGKHPKIQETQQPGKRQESEYNRRGALPREMHHLVSLSDGSIHRVVHTIKLPKRSK